MHDMKKSEDLDRQEYEIRRKHDQEMLIDELEHRIQRLEERLNKIKLLNDLKETEAGDYDY